MTRLARKVSKVEEVLLQVQVLARALSLEAQTLVHFPVARTLSPRAVLVMDSEELVVSSLQIHRKFLSPYFSSLLMFFANRGHFRKMFAGSFGNLNMFGNNQNSFFNSGDDDMGDGTPFSSSGGMPGGMPRYGGFPGNRPHSHPQAKPEKPSEILRPLKLTLEDLFLGTVKHLKIGRRLMNGTTEDKILEIKVLPGWKDGTKIRFPKAGNEVGPHGDSQDLVFVVETKPHERFERKNNDLICHIKIPLIEALAGPATPAAAWKTLQLPDARKIQVPLPSGVIRPGHQTTFGGDGMPIRKEGTVKKKGDLIVKWDLVFPTTLSTLQKDALRRALPS